MHAPRLLQHQPPPQLLQRLRPLVQVLRVLPQAGETASTPAISSTSATKGRKAQAAGATEMHIVGGLNPYLPFDYYTDMLARSAKSRPTSTSRPSPPSSSSTWPDRQGLQARGPQDRRPLGPPAPQGRRARLAPRRRRRGLRRTRPQGGLQDQDRRARMARRPPRRPRARAQLQLHHALRPCRPARRAPAPHGDPPPLPGPGPRAPRLRGRRNDAYIDEEADRGHPAERSRSPPPSSPSAADGAKLPAPRSRSSAGGYYQTITPLPFFPDGSELEHLPGPAGSRTSAPSPSRA